jgi:hypothetical protein
LIYKKKNDLVTNALKRYFDTIPVNDWTCDKCQMKSVKITTTLVHSININNFYKNIQVC